MAKKSRAATGDLVVVRWVDAYDCDGDEIPEGIPVMETAGWLLEDSEVRVVTSPEFNTSAVEDGDYSMHRGFMVIPRDMVLEVVKL